MKPSPVQTANPFALAGVAQANPFQAQAAPRPSINELRSQQNFSVLGQQQQQPMMMPAQPMLVQPVVQPAGPWGPAPSGAQNVASPTFNPFLA